METQKKSQTLYEKYYALNRAMSAPTISPECRAELRPLSSKLKQAAKRARSIELTASQEDARAKVQVLRDHQVATGFRTTRSQNEIFASLNGEDLAMVLRSLNEVE